MLDLRPYQVGSIEELREGFKKGMKRIVLCLPTGAGKTVVFSEMVRLAHEKGTKTLVLTDRTELFKQTIKALGRAGVPVEEIAPLKKNVYEKATVFLAMVETFKRRRKLFEHLQFDLIIIDEAHKGNFTPLLEMFPQSKVIGATATPVGKHFYDYYQGIVQNIDVPELVDQGFLSPCKAYQMVGSFDDLTSKRGEFTPESLHTHYDKPKLFEGVIEHWKKYSLNKKTIVFNCNIQHTEHMHEAFIQEGISSEYITSLTPAAERDRILKAFSSGAFTVLNNCGILTTGYDEPSIECVIMNRATQSLPLWLQCVGRGSRIHPGKKEFIVLDFGGNHERLGMWNEKRIWKLKKKKETLGEAPVKICAECLSVCSAAATLCKECGYIFPIKEKEIAKGVMVAVEPHVPEHLKGKKIGELTIDELIDLQKARKYSPGMIHRVLRSMGGRALSIYAEKMGYKQGWVYMQEQQTDNNFSNFLLK